MKSHTQQRYLAVFAFILILPLLSNNSYACDEQCKREKAEKLHNIKFPSYLNKRYCHQTRSNFLVHTARSLTRYRDTKLAELHRGGMNNTRKFLLQRKDWLTECDTYLRRTSRYRIFRNDKTTNAIFASIDAVNKILGALIDGATYVSDDGNGSSGAAKEKFDRLLSLMDNHKTQLQVAGQLNIN